MAKAGRLEIAAQLVASVLVPVLALCTLARAGIQTFSASCAGRTDLVLDVTPIGEFSDVGLLQCMSLCKQKNCSSFNYGNKECTLLSSFYCASEDTRKALKPKQGYNYYDVSDDPDGERASGYQDSEDCKTKMECSVKCKIACMTNGNKGPAAAGTKCRFPFDFRGTTYNGCTENKYKGNPWCSTDHESQGYNTKKWGTCNPDCPMAND